MTISERIFELLSQKGLNQKQLSNYTGISQSAISDWKKKGTNPSTDKIIRICEFLDVSPYFLLTGEEDANTIDSLTNSEIFIIETFRKFNDYGKTKVYEFINDGAHNPLYIKSGTDTLLEELVTNA